MHAQVFTDRGFSLADFALTGRQLGKVIGLRSNFPPAISFSSCLSRALRNVALLFSLAFYALWLLIEPRTGRMSPLPTLCRRPRL
jgi:hypothetical protein